MRDSANVFHLAIPARDLDETYEFYVTGLGCHLARRYDDRITLDFFGDQVVCHLSDRWERDASDLYPRHFGVTFVRRDEYDNLVNLVELRNLEMYAPVSTRFAGTAEEHLTFVLKDPSNNLLEFKHYLDPRMVY